MDRLSLGQGASLQLCGDGGCREWTFGELWWTFSMRQHSIEISLSLKTGVQLTSHSHQRSQKVACRQAIVPGPCPAAGPSQRWGRMNGWVTKMTFYHAWATHELRFSAEVHPNYLLFTFHSPFLCYHFKPVQLTFNAVQMRVL